MKTKFEQLTNKFLKENTQNISDKDIETFFDMVLGDYLGTLAEAVEEGDQEEEVVDSFIRGAKKIANKLQINIHQYDVDSLLQ
jgi:hypothetical protein